MRTRQTRWLIAIFLLVGSLWLCAWYEDSTAAGQVVANLYPQVFDLAFSPDSRLLAVCGQGSGYQENERIETLRVSDGSLVQSLDSKETVTALAFGPDNKTLFGVRQGQIAALNEPDIADPSSHVVTVPTPSMIDNDASPRAFMATPDGTLTAVQYFAGTVSSGLHRTVWNARNNSLISVMSDWTTSLSPLQLDRQWVVSPKGDLAAVTINAIVQQKLNAATRLSPGSIDIFDLRNGRRLQSFSDSVDNNDGIKALTISQDGSLLAVKDSEGRCLIRDLHTGQIIRMMSGVLGRRKPNSVPIYLLNASTLAISPNDRLLAAGREDGKVKLYDMKTGLSLCTLGEQGDAIKIMKFSPDGTHLATCDMAGTVMLWKVVRQ